MTPLRAARFIAVLVVVALAALLVARFVRGDPGTQLRRAVVAHRAPAAPSVSLAVIWRQSATWPQKLAGLARRRTLRLTDFRGYPVVVNFFASWCGPCQREARVLETAAERADRQTVFLGIDVNDASGDARHFLRSHGIRFAAVRTGDAAQAFGLIGLPETYYVDRRGRIRGITRGELSAGSLSSELQRIGKD